MASGLKLLTLEEFRARYAGCKPHFEYWSGEPVQKAMPTWLHGLIQSLMCDLLREAGFKAGVEIELRISEDWEPVPDVIGATRIERPYPTKPVEIVVEILSPGDPFSQVMAKCKRYSQIEIGQIFVIDPDKRVGFEWKKREGVLIEVSTLDLSNGTAIHLAELWSRLEIELQQNA